VKMHNANINLVSPKVNGNSFVIDYFQLQRCEHNPMAHQMLALFVHALPVIPTVNIHVGAILPVCRL